MLKRAVLKVALAKKQEKVVEVDGNLLGVGLAIDAEVIEIIREGEKEKMRVVEDEQEEAKQEKAKGHIVVPHT